MGLYEDDCFVSDLASFEGLFTTVNDNRITAVSINTNIFFIKGRLRIIYLYHSSNKCPPPEGAVPAVFGATSSSVQPVMTNELAMAMARM